ncbi:ATP-binding cassette permease mdl1 [Friedmanniomyces endolithicus]|nr:ATP-binding cassette permease mdl1 [Friedmanniomyces endolithicus]KAK0771353.1 ATP-binding cassette permease mdl1 [Friedmanniomyces endolithicus]KAK0777312.1 ATP-binding cassette permease mdl1 [Friedmanniomyces endolithicus]KAK0781327.1 ATP-binding cassette permease mdl1 [Friedmanniomyces endolithicus]KAK0836527.1 ATP-binding cassette permease mdl1 [Friedmanniomyces endolithicus]
MAAALPCSRILAHRAWDSLGNGALFTTRIRRPDTIWTLQRQHIPWPSHVSPIAQLRCISTARPRPSLPLPKPSLSSPQARRVLQTSQKTPQEAQVPAKSYREEVRALDDDHDHDDEDADGFKRSAKAAQASQVNLSAKLTKDSDASQAAGGGWAEVRRLLMIAWPERATLGVAVGLLLVSSSISMSVPFSIGKILDAAASKEGTLFGLPMEQFYLGLGALLITGACANYGRIVLLRIVGERVVTKLRSQLFKRTFVQNAEFFDANRVGDLISRLGSDTIIVGKSITQNVSDGLRSLVSAAAGLTLMCYMSVKLTGVIALIFPPVAIGAFFYGRAIRNLSRRIQKNLGTLTKIAEERLGNVRTSQAFAGEQQEVHRYNTQVRKIFALGKREAYISATFFATSGFAGNMTFIGLLYVGGGMVRDGIISIGELTSFLMYAGYAGSSLFGLSGFYSELMKGVGAASRLFELQDRQSEISPTKGDPVKSARGAIEFKGVAFAYPTRPAVKIFNDLSFTIPQGSNIAIVAPSGAGKSTVASLLLRFYAPSSGEITIAGKDISHMNAKQLRRKIGYVGQEPVLFSGTIAENIAYGRPGATRGEIVQAARQANCEFVADFPDGMETFVGARGTQLSGGQKQRLAIARALLKNPDILILDEATSALDAESETLVNQALHRMLEGSNTTISIAHRLSTIQRSDSIIVIGSDGKVAQMGGFGELSADKGGAFAKLMEWQLNGGEAPAASNSRLGGDRAALGPQAAPEEDGEITEEERMQRRLEDHDGVEGEEEVVGEGGKVRGDNETSAEAVLERTKEVGR